MSLNNLCFLTKEEVETITNWISENNYSIYQGYFKLTFRITPCYGNQVDFKYVTDEITDYLTVFDEPFEDRANISADVNTFKIGDVSVNLELNEELSEKYLKIAREKTKAEVNEDIEPSGSSIIFKIFSYGYKIYVNSTLINEAFMPFRELTVEENQELLKDIPVIEIEDDRNVPYFDSENIIKIIERSIEKKFDIYGIECWSSVDFGYFRTYVEEYFSYDFKVPEDVWGRYAIKKLIEDYNKIVLSEEPNNPPVFNITIGKKKQ